MDRVAAFLLACVAVIEGTLLEQMGFSSIRPRVAGAAILIAAFCLVIWIAWGADGFRAIWSALKERPSRRRRKGFDAPKVILIIVVVAIAAVAASALLPSEMQGAIVLPVIVIASVLILVILRVAMRRRP